jgi:hypothetical protein
MVSRAPLRLNSYSIQPRLGFWAIRSKSNRTFRGGCYGSNVRSCERSKRRGSWYQLWGPWKDGKPHLDIELGFRENWGWDTEKGDEARDLFFYFINDAFCYYRHRLITRLLSQARMDTPTQHTWPKLQLLFGASIIELSQQATSKSMSTKS